MAIWQLCANLLIPNCLRSNLSYSPLAALELYVRGGKAHVYTSYFAQKIAETTVKDEGYARLGAQGKSIEFTNNYYISGFRFNKSGEGLIYGSDKK